MICFAIPKANLHCDCCIQGKGSLGTWLSWDMGVPGLWVHAGPYTLCGLLGLMFSVKRESLLHSCVSLEFYIPFKGENGVNGCRFW